MKMQVSQQLSRKRILIVPGSNVSTKDVNTMVDFLLGRRGEPAVMPPAAPPAQ